MTLILIGIGLSGLGGLLLPKCQSYQLLGIPALIVAGMLVAIGILTP